MSQSVPQTQFFNAGGAVLPLPSDWWDGFNDPIMSGLIEQALGANKQIAIAAANIDIARRGLSRSRLDQSYNNGRATELDVNRAEAQYRTTLAGLPRFEAVIDAALSRIAVLTGSNASAPAANVLSLKTTAGPIPSLQSRAAIGSPSDAIRRRPDIRAAEIEIARRLALSDIERARLFPVITLSANARTIINSGLGSQNSTGIGLGLGFGPAISWEGPDLRRVRADIDIADAQTSRAYSVYEQTVLQALSDIETALSNHSNELARRDDLLRAVDAARGALELAQLRFEEGLDDFLDVLDAQRTVLETEDRLAESRLQATLLAVQTYRELGGL